MVECGAKLDPFDDRLPPGVWSALRGRLRGIGKADGEEQEAQREKANRVKTK